MKKVLLTIFIAVVSSNINAQKRFEYLSTEYIISKESEDPRDAPKVIADTKISIDFYLKIIKLEMGTSLEILKIIESKYFEEKQYLVIRLDDNEYSHAILILSQNPSNFIIRSRDEQKENICFYKLHPLEK